MLKLLLWICWLQVQMQNHVRLYKLILAIQFWRELKSNSEIFFELRYKHTWTMYVWWKTYSSATNTLQFWISRIKEIQIFLIAEMTEKRWTRQSVNISHQFTTLTFYCCFVWCKQLCASLFICCCSCRNCWVKKCKY